MRKELVSVGWFALFWMMYIGFILVLVCLLAFLIPLLMNWIRTGTLGFETVVIDAAWSAAGSLRAFVFLVVGLSLLAAVGTWRENYPREGKAWWAK